jgi:hypothetical protein
MLGCSWVVAQLAASQEGHTSMSEWGRQYISTYVVYICSIFSKYELVWPSLLFKWFSNTSVAIILCSVTNAMRPADTRANAADSTSESYRKHYSGCSNNAEYWKWVVTIWTQVALPTVKPHTHWNNYVSTNGISRTNLKITFPRSLHKCITIRVQSQNISDQLLFRMLRDSRSTLLHFLGVWGSQSRYQAEFCLLPSSSWFPDWLIRPWKWRRHVLPKCRLILNGLHDIISQMIQLFIIFCYKNIFLVVIRLLSLFAFSFSCLRKLFKLTKLKKVKLSLCLTI